MKPVMKFIRSTLNLETTLDYFNTKEECMAYLQHLHAQLLPGPAHSIGLIKTLTVEHLRALPSLMHACGLWQCLLPNGGRLKIQLADSGDGLVHLHLSFSHTNSGMHTLSEPVSGENLTKTFLRRLSSLKEFVIKDHGFSALAEIVKGPNSLEVLPREGLLKRFIRLIREKSSS